MKNKLQSNFQNVFIILFILIFSTLEVLSQSKSNSDFPFIKLLDRALTKSEIFIPPPIQKTPGHYSYADWQVVIDSVWGPGLPTAQKLEIFDTAWDTINAKSAASQNLEVNIDSLRDLYRPEIESGVSRGRFAGIMSHLSLAMKECHTVILDVPVSWGTPILPEFLFS